MPLISVQVGLALRNDLDKKIPRPEVEEIQRVVQQHLDRICTGCLATITGGRVFLFLSLFLLNLS